MAGLSYRVLLHFLAVLVKIDTFFNRCFNTCMGSEKGRRFDCGDFKIKMTHEKGDILLFFNDKNGQQRPAALWHHYQSQY